MVDIGGRQMHLVCIGANRDGRPTVILEQGGGGNVLAWFRIQPELALVTGVCAYDRAGLGWSEPGPEPRDGTHIASDLHTLLARAGVPGPYVLAGHSYGGLFSRAYAAQYPDEVAGLVLLDSAHPDQWTRTPEGQARYTADSQLYRGARILALFGLLRLGSNRLRPSPRTGRIRFGPSGARWSTRTTSGTRPRPSRAPSWTRWPNCAPCRRCQQVCAWPS
jgi:pimeloyl-ACP methyl ester carboxylesterase